MGAVRHHKGLHRKGPPSQKRNNDEKDSVKTPSSFLMLRDTQQNIGLDSKMDGQFPCLYLASLMRNSIFRFNPVALYQMQRPLRWQPFAKDKGFMVSAGSPPGWFPTMLTHPLACLPLHVGQFTPIDTKLLIIVNTCSTWIKANRGTADGIYGWANSAWCSIFGWGRLYSFLL